MSTYKVAFGSRRRTSYRDGLTVRTGAAEERSKPSAGIMEEDNDGGGGGGGGSETTTGCKTPPPGECGAVYHKQSLIDSLQRKLIANAALNTGSKGNVSSSQPKLKKFRKYDTFIWLREPSNLCDGNKHPWENSQQIALRQFFVSILQHFNIIFIP